MTYLPYGAISAYQSFNLPTNFVNNPGPNVVMPGDLGLPNFGANVPQAGGGMFGDMNGLQIGQLGLQGLGTLGNLWNSWQAQKLAKKQFNFQKDFSMANYANQVSSYNTQLEDRARARGVMEGRPESYADEYVAEHRLSDTVGGRK